MPVLPRSTQYRSWRLSFTTTALLVLGIFASIAAVANAQTTTEAVATSSVETTATTSTTTPEQPAPIATEAAPIRSNASLTPPQQRRLINLAANVSNRFDATIERLEKVSDRLDRRLATIQTEGGDVSAAASQLQTAKISLSNARAALSTIDTDMFVVATSPNPASNWQAVRQKYVAAREHIQSTKTALRAAVQLAKNI